MSAHVTRLEMSGLVLPDGANGLRRDRVGGRAFHDADYDARYDWKTLFYDCFVDTDTQCVTLIGPPLLNFAPLLEEADFTVDGKAVEITKVEDLSRCTLVRLSAVSGTLLTVSHRLFGANFSIGKSFVEELAGMNAVYTISRNNRLEWITDWLQFYVREHGLEAVVLSDNGSTDYTPQDLSEAIASVPQLKRAFILHARYPFGPTAENNAAYKSLFLQRSLAEMIRIRFLAKARAVLNADIDEFFDAPDGLSVFDAAVASEQGYLRADATWVYIPELGKDLPRHADHTHVSANGRPKANRKWCIVPTGPMRGKQWLTHFIDSRKDPVDPRFCMWHFRQISTSWKTDRAANSVELVPDRRLIETMRRTFNAVSD